MTSYLVYIPPGGKPLDNIRLIADRFTWLTFIFPAFWLLFKRQWLAGITVFVLQGAIAVATAEPNVLIAGLLAEMALRLLVALEGPRFIASRVEAAGWTLHTVISAPDRATAEAICDSLLDTVDIPTSTLSPSSTLSLTSASIGKAGTPAFGLFETYGER